MAHREWTTDEHPAGCSKNPSSKAAASEEARRTLRYVEPLSEARKKLADFFSIMLDQPLASSHFLQFKVSPRCCFRPSSVETQGRFVIGGWCRTC